MPVPSNAYPGLPLVLFTGRTLLALETKRDVCRRPERQAAGLSVITHHGLDMPPLKHNTGIGQ
jgi:hypothetical protein